MVLVVPINACLLPVIEGKLLVLENLYIGLIFKMDSIDLGNFQL